MVVAALQMCAAALAYHPPQGQRACEAWSGGGRSRCRGGAASPIRRSTFSVTPTAPIGAPPSGGHSALSSPS